MDEISEHLLSPLLGRRLHRKASPFASSLFVLALVSILLTTTYLFHAPILAGWGNFLVVRDRLDRADVIVLLTGDFNNRPKIVAQLLRAGLADKVLVAQVKRNESEEFGLIPDRTSLHVQMLGKFGVPESSIVVLNLGDGVTSTFEEALSVKHYLEEHPRQRRLILVTSAFHTRRAKWIFRKLLNGPGVEIQVAPAPYGTFDVDNWWQNEDGLLYFVTEYLKLGFYFVKY